MEDRTILRFDYSADDPTSWADSYRRATDTGEAHLSFRFAKQYYIMGSRDAIWLFLSNLEEDCLADCMIHFKHEIWTT